MAVRHDHFFWLLTILTDSLTKEAITVPEKMGKAYSEEQRATVRGLLEAGTDEDTIEKQTGVSDRTIRRWKLELERTGRIGKPPESRTGRHRVLNPEVEAALFEHVKEKPDMSVDDMLWWLYDTYKLVVGTRTIRRVFERKGDKVKGKAKGGSVAGAGEEHDNDDGNDAADQPQSSIGVPYQSPYAPMQTAAQNAEQQLQQAFQQQQPPQPQTPYPPLPNMESELPEDEETVQLQLQQIALQKREVELKLKLRRMQQGRGTPGKKLATPQTPSSLYNPEAHPEPTGPKRDSRSKKKIEESKKRTAERQERMLRDLERRSRRRDHLTAEWVQSKDIWPLRAQGMLADLMHQYGTYAFSQNNVDTFEAMYRDLYQLVDLQKGDWVPQVHDELLRERMKRKMAQLRSKMQKTGEIIGRTDAYGGWQRAENYTGQAAGEDMGDESELQDPSLIDATLQDPSMQQQPLHHDQTLQAQAGAAQMQHVQQQEPPQHEQIQYEPLADHQMHQHAQMPYGAASALMGHAAPSYPAMMHHPHQQMLPYNMDAMQPQGMQNQEGMAM